MTWYYVDANERKGPVDQSDFDRLVQTGTINGTTLIWREGMVDWKSYGELPSASSAPPLAGSLAATEVCSQCGRAFAFSEMIRLGSGFVCAACKPIALQKMQEGVADNSSEAIRQEHIKHEASVKSVGFLYLFSAVLMFVFGGMGVFVIGSAQSGGGGSGLGVMLGLILLVLAGVQVWVGLGLRRLRTWARIPAGILSGIGLLSFPLGTIINLYVLYLLFSRKGKMVFSPQYRRIIEETPHIQYKTSVVVWIFLALLLVLMGLAVIGAIFGSRM